jgi:hypothetical protein
VNEVGLSMVVDPRWIVAVPENVDVAAEVARQLGPVPEGVEVDDWATLAAAVTSMLRSALDAGVRWSGVWFAVDQRGTLVLTRATLAVAAMATTVDGPLSVQQLFDETIVEHRDDDERAEIGMISTSLGTAVAHRQVVVVGDAGEDRALVGDHAGFAWVADGCIVDLRAFCSEVGWAGVWYPQLEAMAQTLRVDPDASPTTLTMVAYVVDDESLNR